MLNYLAKRETEVKLFIPFFYAVGVFGMLYPALFPVFTKLISFTLILSFIILAAFHPEKIDRKSLVVFLFIYLFGFFIEVIGVNTGLIFGHYEYGSSLGVKLFNTPLIIGLNWLLLVYATSSVFEKAKMHTIVKIILASIIMLGYDIILEQVAPKMDMWSWNNNVVPYQNYFAWFLLAVLFHSLIKINRINTRNKLGLTILSVQFVFFLILTAFLK